MKPKAELAKLGCIILSPGKENSSIQYFNAFFTKRSVHEYANLYSSGCLGIDEKRGKNNLQNS